MNTFNSLTIEKANSKSLSVVKELLKESGLIFWISNDETYKNFYTITDKRNIIGCFAIDYENTTGILKSFAIKKDLQGKGIGKKIVSMIPELCKSLKIKDLYAASKEAPDFWRKTLFEEIDLPKVTNDYYLKYSEYLKNKLPEVFDQTKIFYLNTDY